jgi:Bacterial Ig-like domain (group 3)/FG-GAP-like repeat
MRHLFTCFPSSLLSFLVRRSYKKAFGVLFLLALAHAAQAATPAVATTTTLLISSDSVPTQGPISVPYQTPIILTATVTATANNAPVTAGLILFCEATAKYCENTSALGVAQLTFPGATAVVKIGSGPVGNHSYKAVFRANDTYATSSSNTVDYTVTGTYTSSTSLASTGVVGKYSLAGTVVGVGSLTTGPTGSISFLDTSASNNVLGTEKLNVSSLTTTFLQGSPFAIGTTGGGGTTNRSVAIASAYLDNDNNLDVVTGDEYQTISVLLGNGDGTFQPKVNYDGCNVGVALQILLADFNRDGITDVALACSDGSNGGLVIIFGKGDGSFQSPVAYSTGDAAGIAIGDFNNDGLLDIAVTDGAQQKVTFFLGDGKGNFSPEKTTLSTPSPAHGVVVADFNGDGFDDVAFAVATAVPNSSLSDLYVAFGNGTGTFKQPTAPVVSQIGEFLTVGDTNADDIPDIISCTINLTTRQSTIGNSLFVSLGVGNGTFKPTATYVSDIPSDPHLTDVNGDGIPDIIAGGSYGALVYIGNGNGTFQPYQEPVIGGFALTYAVNAGDFNNDGNADLIGTNADEPQAAVSLSQVQQSSIASALTDVAVFPLGSGIHEVDAHYSGDSIYFASTSSTVPLTAAPVNTSLTLTTSLNATALAGQSATLTALLSPYTVGPPTTTTNGDPVTFYSGTTLLGSGNLLSGVASLTTTALPLGADSLTAVFAGNTNYNPSTSNTVGVAVSNILVSSSNNPSTYLQTVAFTATVATNATGTVTFYDGASSIGTSSLSGKTATFTTSTLLAGSHNITAQYASSTSPILVQVVNKATPTVTVTTPGSSTYGAPVTIIAAVPPDATGTITFTTGTTTLGSGTIVSGSVTISTTALTVPSDTITAAYSGDSNYKAASGTASQLVVKASPTSVLTSSINPSLPGSSVTFTDTLPKNVTGTVIFSNGSSTLATSAVSNGVATFATSALPLGSQLITATYSGDGNNNTSVATYTQTIAKVTPVVTVTTSGPTTYGQSVQITASVPVGPTGTITITSGGVILGSGTITSTNGNVTISTTTLPVSPAGGDIITASYSGDNTNNVATGSTAQTVSKVSPSITLTSSLNPSTFEQSVTFAAALPATASGTITFTNGSTVMGTPSIANGVATITTSSLPAGSNTITAAYSGDGNNNATSAKLTQTVNKATPTVTVSTSGPSTSGGSVSITTTVPPGVTGTVTITSGGVTIGSGPINPITGTVTITTTTLPVGSDPITATYGGDTNDNPSTGSTTQTVAKLQPAITLVSSVNPSTPNQAVMFTATLPAAVTGTVTFTNGSMNLGSPSVVNGVATVTTSSLAPGNDTITALYNGDSNNYTATANLTQVVNKTTPTITVSTSGPSIYGGSVAITTTLPPGTTGTVTLTSGGVTLGSGTVNPITGTVVISTTTLPVGSDMITSSYGGDTTNAPVSGSATQIVTKAQPTVALTSSANPSVTNQSVTFTATLSSGATGTVTFTNAGASLGTVSSTGGVATITTSTLVAGDDPILATYNGDSNNNSASATLTQVVNKSTPVLPPPAVSSSSLPVGSPETITETVPTGVTGTVTFFNGTTPLGSATVVNGVATITTSSLPLGSDSITAATLADANNNAAISPATPVAVNKITPTLVPPTVSTNNTTPNSPVTITEPIPSGVTGPVSIYDGSTLLGTVTIVNGGVTLTVPSLPLGTDPITVSTSASATMNPATSPSTPVTVAKTAPIVTVVSSANPSSPNQQVTFTATVHAGATGSITFIDGTTILGSGTISASGIATFSTSTLTIGSHPITASYGGDSNYSSTTSTVLMQVVGRIPTTIVLTESSPAQLLATGVTFTASVTASAPDPTGTVTFMDGSTVLGTISVNASGGVATSLTKIANAAMATSNLATGAHQIVAIYSGDSNFAPSTSIPADNIVEDFTNKNSGPASQNLFPGASTSYTFSLAPVSATTFLNDVTVTVAGLPPGSTYTFTPATITAGSGTTSVTLNVQTSSSLSAQNHPPQGNSHSELPIALGMLGLVGLGSLRKMKLKMPRILVVLLVLLGSLLPITALTGCAGGYFNLSPTTYSLTVTGIEGSVQHAASATLIVQ